MITISTEKGLIKVDEWNDIIERPGFKQSLNPNEHELASILGRYVFAEKVHCGLSNCGTPHTKGYIVATKDGNETNIGKDCGKNYFGVDFELMARQFDRDMTEKENRDLLWNFTFQLEEFETKIATLRSGEKGADWVHKHSQVLINPNPRMPLEVVRTMAAMVKTKSDVLRVQRQATEHEIENEEALQNKKIARPYYIDEPVANILGIEALYPENDLRKLLVLELEEKIKTFKSKKIDEMTFEELSKWKKWAVSVDLTLETASTTTRYGQELLSHKNLVPLLKVIEKGQDQDLFRNYLETIRDE